MHLTYRNVNEAFRGLVEMFHNEGSWAQRHNAEMGYGDARPAVVRRPSRNGDVLVIDGPVTVTYTHPRERVLFNAARDANPFFHVYEALWMLAGRRDVDPVAYYCHRMTEFSDNGRWFNAAYGHRWRNHLCATNGRNDVSVHKVDQLDLLVEHLKSDPNSRRAVLQMWTPDDDLQNVGWSKDVCCNLSVMFSLRDYYHSDWGDQPAGVYKKLDMTVTNRSNDLIWGLLGANYVHFTFLQEYLAARLGAEVGRYHHFTNNLHVYSWNWEPEKWLGWRQEDNSGWGGRLSIDGDYSLTTKTVPLAHNPEAFGQELPQFVEWAWEYNQFKGPDSGDTDLWSEPFLAGVADPMVRTYRAHKNKGATALAQTRRIKADDWRAACTAWLERRVKNRVG